MKKNRIILLAGILSVMIPCNIYAQEEDSLEIPVEESAGVEEEKALEVKRAVKTDDYLQVAYYEAKKTDYRSGKFHVSLNKKTGSFRIYVINSEGKEIPVLSDVNGGVSSFVSVLFDKREYRLNREAGVKTEVREFENGNHCQISYSIDEKVQVTIDFKTMATDIAEKDDVLKVSVYVTNTSKKSSSYSLKILLDTILGENFSAHFTTGTGTAIKGESSFETMAVEKSIISSNEDTSVQFILNGKGILNPQQVMLANRDILSGSKPFKPDSVEGRSFSTVAAYNNSAICINWPQVKLSSGNSNYTSFYIVAGTDGEKPAGEAFIRSLAGLPPVLDVVQNTVELEEPEEAQPVVTEEQLDTAYIQNLIDRINSLQSDPDLVDRSEVKRLNRELDAIFEKIRQQQ